MELAHLQYKKGRSYEDYLGLAGLERQGKKKWRQHVKEVVEQLKAAVQADYVVLGEAMPDWSKSFRPARVWGAMPTRSKADTAFGASFTADQLMSDSSIKQIKSITSKGSALTNSFSCSTWTPRCRPPFDASIERIGDLLNCDLPHSTPGAAGVTRRTI
jgi:hypothetical protein